MRRRFNHNAKLIQELYGGNLSLDSLLNEQETGRARAKQAFKNIIQKARDIDIKIVKKGETKVAAVSQSDDIDDVAVTTEDAKAQLNDELNDPNITDERRRQIENVAGQIANVAPDDQKSDFRDIERRASSSEGTTSAGGGEKEADKSGSSASGKKPNPKTKAIQEIIDPDEKKTKSDGFWGKGTSAAWYAWCGSSEFYDLLSKVSDSKISQENKNELTKYGANLNKQKAHITAQKAGFTPDLDGVHDLVMALAGGTGSKTFNPPEENFSEIYENAFEKAKKDYYNKIDGRFRIDGDSDRALTNIASVEKDKLTINLDKTDKSTFVLVFKDYKVKDVNEAKVKIESYDEGVLNKQSGFDDFVSLGDLVGKHLNTKALYNNIPRQPNVTGASLYFLSLYGISKQEFSEPLKETVYGKSRGQLYRERYWGRY